jgi:hypothetical protein
MVGAQTKILNLLRSRRFFVAILILFFVESAWIALSAAYPQVFDENWHFGIIQLYAHQWSPLFLHQPPHTDWAGALTRDPSYMYHYLMSFPYRLIAEITNSQTAQVIFLRFINIALFGSGLVLFRKLLLKTKVSPAIVNTALLFFILTPVVPLLAGQINYDNMVLPLTALALLITTSVIKKLNAGIVPIVQLATLTTLCMFNCLVKVEFSPVFAGIVLWLAWQVWRQSRLKTLQPQVAIRQNWQTISWKQRLAFAAPFAVVLGLFVQMYGVNVVVYHNITPQCDQVMSRQACASYAPWQRNQDVLAHKSNVNANPVLFLGSWLYRMFVAMFFTSSGGGASGTMYLSVNPLPVVFGAALFVFGVGLLLVALYHRKVFAGYDFIGLLLCVSLIYFLAIFIRNYHDYVSLGEKIAIQGRYLFPIALPCMLIIALGFRQLFGHKAHLKVALLMAVFLLFLQGGGALTYILNSNQSWYWQNRVVSRVNRAAQGALGPLVVNKKPVAPIGLSAYKH